MSLYVVHASSLYVYYVKPLVVASILDYFDVSLSLCNVSQLRARKPFQCTRFRPPTYPFPTSTPLILFVPTRTTVNPKAEREKGGVTRLGKRLAEKC